MMNDATLLAMPIAIPLLSVGVLLCFRSWSEVCRNVLNIAACGLQTAVAVALFGRVGGGDVIALHSGGWPAPIGITLVADVLGAVMVLVTAVIGLVVAVYAAGEGTHRFRGYFAPLYQSLLLGVNGAFLTADLFNLYVWFEVMLMSSFVLVALPGGRARMEAGVKYLTLNFIASAFFLLGLGVLYGTAGTLNMADLAMKYTAGENEGLMTASVLLFLVAFGIKGGVFPFYFWLPSSYHVTPTPVAALFAGLLTKVGVYSCMRVFTLVYPENQELLGWLLIPIGILTMVTGVFGAATQFLIPRILSFHIISQIGYMIVGLALFTKGAMAATVFYIVHHILVKANLFLVGGLVGRKLGTQQLERTGGLYAKLPMLGLLFLIPAMSLGGIPPLSGFFAKFALIREALLLERWWVVFFASAVGLLTLYSMIKIWNEAFWKAAPEGEPLLDRKLPFAMVAPCVALAVCTVAFGIFPGYFHGFAVIAADQLMEPEAYIEAVMRGRNGVGTEVTE